MARLFACLLLTLISWTLDASAPRPVNAAPADSSATAPDTVYAAPAIMVEGERPQPIADVEDRTGFVSVVDLRKRRHRVEDLALVLNQTTGVRVRQYGGLGSYSTLSIRGSSSSQVDLFLDGIPLNDAYLGVTNLGDLPLDGIDRIEVFRGYTPPHLGSVSIGGAVNLVTSDPQRWRGEGPLSRVEVVASYGSYQTTRYSASVWSDLGVARLYLHGGHWSTLGNFDFLDDQSTPFNLNDDTATVRVNNDGESTSAIARLFVELARAGTLTLGYTHLDREQGVPGLGSFQSRSARTSREGGISNANFASQPLLGEHMTVFAGAYYSRTKEQFHDPDGDLAFVAQDTDNTFRNLGVNARIKVEVPRLPLSLEAFHRSKTERYSPQTNLPQPSSGPDRDRQTHTSVVAAELRVDMLRLSLNVAERRERYITEFYDPPLFPWLPPAPQGKVERDVRTPQYGFRWQPLGGLTVKGNWGRYVRPPTMLELFGNSGSVSGRADLKPEEGVNRDIGVMLSTRRAQFVRMLSLEVAYLDNEVNDLIVFFPNSQFTTRPQNIGSARIRGWEFAFSTMFSAGLRVSGNYTSLDAVDSGPIPYYNGNALPGRPADDAALSLDYYTGPVRFTYEFQYISANFLDPANLSVAPSRNLHNLALQLFMFSSPVSIAMEVRNVTENRISDVSGYPLPGRSIFATLSYQP